MSTMNQEIDFYGWSKEDIEDGLNAMGCQGVSTSPFLLGIRKRSIKASLLSSDESAELHQKRKRRCLKSSEYQRCCFKSIQSTKYQLFNDPIHGSIELHPLLSEIVKMRAFTRLKNVRQLGGVYYVYPGATHTRFEHSIGTCYIAGEFIRMLQRKQPELCITEKEALCVQIAALCHDLGHGPFSHVFEKDILKEIEEAGGEYSETIEKFPKHEELSKLVFQSHVYDENRELFDSYGIDHDDIQLIKELIDHDLSADKISKLLKPKRRFLYEIVANKCTGIDVDKWDYFARDCKYMGILTEFDWRRLMAVSRIFEVDDAHRICYREKEVNNIYGMFRTRASLHQKAYQHKSVIAAEGMIVLAICAVKELRLIKPWTSRSASADSEVKCISIMEAIADVANSHKCEGYLALNDSIVHLILHCDGKTLGFKPNEIEKLKIAQKLLNQLDEREMYCLVAKKDKADNISVSEIIACGSGKLEKNDVFQRPVQISYGSEDKQVDPVKKTYFYTKREPWNAKMGDQIPVSDLVRPTKFESYEIWTYGSPSKYNEVVEAFKKAASKAKPKSGSGSMESKADETATSSTS